jgi:hypothetical protein
MGLLDGAWLRSFSNLKLNLLGGTGAENRNFVLGRTFA